MARPSKDKQIIAKINTIVGSKVATKDLATFCECSYPTIINFIRSYPERFIKVGFGLYLIVEENTDTVVSVKTQDYPEEYVDPVIKYVTQQFDW